MIYIDILNIIILNTHNKLIFKTVYDYFFFKYLGTPFELNGDNEMFC